MRIKFAKTKSDATARGATVEASDEMGSGDPCKVRSTVTASRKSDAPELIRACRLCQMTCVDGEALILHPTVLAFRYKAHRPWHCPCCDAEMVVNKFDKQMQMDVIVL